MPSLSESEAAERLAAEVEKARPSELPEIYTELFPEKTPPPQLIAHELVHHIRNGLAPEELVDLWNVIFPCDRNVWHDEEEGIIRYNEEVVGYAD